MTTRWSTPQTPVLHFSPYAWAKLLYLRDLGPTEVAGFGLALADNLLLASDLQLVKQHSTWASAKFDDQAVADYFDDQVDLGRKPAQFARLFLHTHPGDSPQPSSTDEETFARCFGGSDWAVMFILARGGASYARLQFHVGPGGSVQIPVEVDWPAPFPESRHEQWLQDYKLTVNIEELQPQEPKESQRWLPGPCDRSFDRDRSRFHEMSFDEWDLWEDPASDRGGFLEDDGWSAPTTEEWWAGLRVDEQLEHLEWMARDTCQRLHAAADATDQNAPQLAAQLAVQPAGEPLTTGVSA